MVRLRLMILSLLAMSCLSLRAEQFADSVRVHFRVNRTVIDTLLMGNDAAMRSFAARMAELSAINGSADKEVTINSLVITGAASPEGSIALNERLSRDRAAAITSWLRGYFEFPDTLPQFIFKGRDWRGLLVSVIGDPDVPYKKEVVGLLYDILTTPPSTSYKSDGVARLKALRGGVPYRYLARKHFPGLRASEVFVTATVEPAPSEPAEPAELYARLDSSDVAPPDSSCVSLSPDIPVLPTGGGYLFAVKSNLLYDAALVPNLGVEFPVGKGVSVGANWMYAWWKNHGRNRQWRIYGGDINARYYFGESVSNRRQYGDCKSPLTGHHIGVYGQVLVFQVAFGGDGYISGIPGQNLWGKPWFGGGVEYGYSRQISRRLNLDFTIGIGYLGGEYRKYRPVDNHYVWQSSRSVNWFGPTKAEISLVWLIGKLPAKKGGAE